jgi:hypothetical protein
MAFFSDSANPGMIMVGLSSLASTAFSLIAFQISIALNIFS